MRDSAVSPCFHGCLAFLHRHFPPQSPPSHPLNPSLHSQQPLPWDCSTILKLQLPASAPSMERRVAKSQESGIARLDGEAITPFFNKNFVFLFLFFFKLCFSVFLSSGLNLCHKESILHPGSPSHCRVEMWWEMSYFALCWFEGLSLKTRIPVARWFLEATFSSC